MTRKTIGRREHGRRKRMTTWTKASAPRQRGIKRSRFAGATSSMTVWKDGERVGRKRSVGHARRTAQHGLFGWLNALLRSYWVKPTKRRIF